MTEFNTVLVANRGEIARRVFAAARLRGMATAAVYSDADADAPFAREADAAVRLPGTSPTDTYLNIPLILEAAARTGADAIHPGYGFLSENADFARAVTEAGLTWIGPSPEAIIAMGSKTRAKEIMADAGVPVLTNLTVDEITEDMLPVLVKASAGGGGRGMRVVRSLDDLPSEVEAARAEAASAFGDGTVFIERYIENGRHIEVQLMADAQGTVWAVGERECSIQRRHQKVIEEAPSPLVERIDGMREKLFTASRAAATAIGYTGAGTVEFLANDRGEFFFLEVNTRLQVEHPVTEATTGLDLVGLQFDVAAGRPLPAATPPATTGWAVEARLYAEDPAHDYRPRSGELTRLDIDGVVSEFSGPAVPGIRLDTGPVPEPGRPGLVGVDYDAMLAKVIAWAPSRSEAVGRLSAALRRARIHGLGTNRDQLVRVLDDTDFRAGDFSTSFLETGQSVGTLRPLADPAAVALSAFAAAVSAEHADRQAVTGDTGTVDGVRPGFRIFGSAVTEHRFVDSGAGSDGEEFLVRIVRDRDSVRPEGRTDVAVTDITGGGDAATTVTLDVGGVRRILTVHSYLDGVTGVDSPLGPVDLIELPRYEDPSQVAAAGSLTAPMPGTVLTVTAAVGDEVTAGHPLLTIEAMKMQHTIAAPVDGVVAELPVTVGQHIDTGALLAVISSEKDN
ncbi:acetyl/propionyl/methylcrotonyl-CoA carboxylase subunit alpha [Corynebacterium terpenotabidum]|uniref:biotin carboxylase n=1 Tax=Corynebacterium terpenotabidum Y-11 TaxID=1200352 RepID=S4XFK7_9CORY|nr:biotin carboxylase N-terminal domain-containing protein [Corynebacterium terpenotabidum]AGP31341.1 methylcrotonoyl-CoA carboxylase subunit alpha [Corynebacterium terpenotabidum Y-11]